jgi:hypothetical protein
MADTFRGAQHDAAVRAAGFARHQPARGWEAEAGEGETLSTIIAFDRQLRQLCTLHHDTCAAETRCQLLAAAQDDAARLPRALTDVRKAWHVWRKWCVEKLLQKHTSTAQHFFQKLGASGPWQIHSGALSTMPQSEQQDSRGISRREAEKLRREKEKQSRQSLPSIDSFVRCHCHGL